MGTSISTEKVFRRRQKVAAAVDMPGVPVGTFGKVWFVSGITWIRYHVAFENGEEMANVDAAQLVDRKAWTADRAKIELAERQAAQVVERDERRAELLANLADEPSGH